MGIPLTRRQFIRKSALVAATFPIALTSRPAWSLSRQAGSGVAVPMNLELVTVTDTTATVTWFTGDPTQLDEFGRPLPVAAPGRVLLGTTPLDLFEVGAHGPTPYHHVEIRGLRPSTRYVFRAESNGLPATGVVLDPVALHPLYADLPPEQRLTDLDTTNAGIFTTLTPPAGEEIARLAWFNDMHYGEQISGIATRDVDLGDGRGFPPGFPVDPANPYWRFMGDAAVDEAVARGAGLLLVNGDLTNEAEPAALAEVKAALDRFGSLGSSRRTPDGDFAVSAGDPPAYWVTRGNHDRAHQGDEHAHGTPVEGHPDYFDTFRDTFAQGWAPGSATSRFAVVIDSPSTRWRFVGLDSNNLLTGAGQLDAEQLGYLEAQLGAAAEPTFVLCHHPAGLEANLTSFPPFIAGVPEGDAGPFREILARHRDEVIGVYAGHTHRNNRTRSPETGDLPFYEGGSTKEYPGGYTIVRLYEGGYMVNFHKTAHPEARAWSERSRGEYLGLYPYYTLGALADRNWTYEVDARRRRDPSEAGTDDSPGATDDAHGTTDPPTATMPSDPPAATLPVTGATRPLVAAGAAAAAGLVGRRIVDDDRR